MHVTEKRIPAVPARRSTASSRLRFYTDETHFGSISGTGPSGGGMSRRGIKTGQ